MKVFIIPPQILAYYLYLTLTLYWKMLQVAFVAAARCLSCSLRCIEMSSALREIWTTLPSPRSHLYWGKKPVEATLINSVQDEDCPLLFAIPQLPTEWFCLISPLLLRPLWMPVSSLTLLLAAFAAFGSIECLKVSWGFQIFMISKFHCANKIINPQCVGRVVTFQNGAAFVPEVPIEKAAWTLHSLGSFIFWGWTMDPEYFILASTEFTMPVLKQSSW